MKKILVVLMVMFSTASSIYAVNPVDYEVFYKLEDASTFSRLIKYLNADDNQAENMKNVIAVSNSKLKLASKSENESDAKVALSINLVNARRILTAMQYKRYVSIIELTINNNCNEVLLSER